MKTRLAIWFWFLAAVSVIAGFIYIFIPSRPNRRGPQLVAETRQSLRQQGFKTDLADFDFSTSPEMRAREAALKATEPTNRFTEFFRDHPNLMEIVGTNSAIVVWKEDILKRQNPSWPDNSDQLTWDELHAAVATNAPMDAACAAILAGPIGFNLDSRGGNAMRLPHLALMKNLTQTLGSWMVLNLHDGDIGAAFTNLLAATRLVTAWNPEPAEISHLVRFGDAKLVFNATWQALQADGWPDERLARLQEEWAAANFLTNLPEVPAFKWASDMAACERDRHEILESRLTFKEFVTAALQSPSGVWYELQSRWSQGDYFRRGIYEDETNLLLFGRDREIEMRQAVPAPTWERMRQLPGVTNKIFFRSKYRSRLQTVMNLHEITLAFQRQGSSFLGRAATAEVERRILITAIALERHRGKYGFYPNSLTQLSPEFLQTVPLDFMDGQPLRYRLVGNGHFLLYSVEEDCADDGGKLPAHEWETRLPGGATRFEAPPQADIVWPLPATDDDVIALRQRQERAKELRNLSVQDRESEEDWRQSPLRQARVEKILAMNWPADTNMEMFAGQRVVDLVGNKRISETNPPSLAELLTPKPIIAGGEPENLTFDVPVNYDAITNLGALILLVDADPGKPMGDSGGRIQDCNRADNGDCLLVWHTIFDPPGNHAVQVQLVLSSRRGGEYLLKGPAIPVVTTNFCQFSLNSATYEVERGAIFHTRLPEKNGLYSIECVTTNGEHLKTISGSTTNGEFKEVWNLVDDHGNRLHGETFNSIVHITLPDSGRTQTLRGP
jgi:hypothetical protein